jgi:hypothetical protein
MAIKFPEFQETRPSSPLTAEERQQAARAFGEVSHICQIAGSEPSPEPVYYRLESMLYNKLVVLRVVAFPYGEAESDDPYASRTITMSSGEADNDPCQYRLLASDERLGIKPGVERLDPLDPSQGEWFMGLPTVSVGAAEVQRIPAFIEGMKRS